MVLVSPVAQVAMQEVVAVLDVTLIAVVLVVLGMYFVIVINV